MLPQEPKLFKESPKYKNYIFNFNHRTTQRYVVIYFIISYFMKEKKLPTFFYINIIIHISKYVFQCL